jgi:hypothetical protein
LNGRQRQGHVGVRLWASWCEACKPLDAARRARAAKNPRMALRR